MKNKRRRVKQSIRIDDYGFEMRKKKGKVKRIAGYALILLSLAIVCLFLCLLIFNSFDKANNIDKSYIPIYNFLMPFWGSAIGGIISGLLTLIGVIVTVNYYKKSDEDRIRREHMPFIVGKLYEMSEEEIRVYLEKKSANEPNIMWFALCDSPESNYAIRRDYKKRYFYKINIMNIGKGIATHIKFDEPCNSGHGNYFEYIDYLYNEDNIDIYLELTKYLDGGSITIGFSCSYKDIMLNPYYQEFEIEYPGYSDGNDEHPRFHCNSYPIFVDEDGECREYYIVGMTRFEERMQRYLYELKRKIKKIHNIKKHYKKK